MKTAVPVGPSIPVGGPRPYTPRGYLTVRQRQVLVLAANGHTNKAIGRQLGIYEHTVKSLMKSILRALHVDDRAQAAAVALRLGILALDDIVLPPALALHHAGRP
jgi:DNA-binding NarL/FixJ family response regulator